MKFWKAIDDNQDMQIHQTDMKKYQSAIAYFCIGSLILICFSTLQKLAVGAPFVPHGYIVPFFFGGISGLIVRYFIDKVLEKKERLHVLNTYLQNDVQNKQRELQKSKENLRLTLDSIGDAALSTDTNGLIEWMNPVAERLTGWSLEEAKNKSLSDILHILSADSREISQNPLDLVLQTGRIQGLASRTLLVSKQGQEHLIADSASPIQDDEGHIHGMILVFRDVTHEETMKRMMEKRLELEDYSLSHDLDEILTKVLDEVEGLVDSRISFYHFVHADQETLTLQQWSTRTLREFCSVEAKGRHYPIAEAGVWVDSVRDKEPIIHNDYTSVSHKKGLPRGHPEVSRELVVPVLREDKIVAFLGVGNKPHDYTETDKEIVSFFADVTWGIVQRKRAEQELRKNQEELGAAYENAPLIMLLADENRKVRKANPYAAELLGKSLEKLHGEFVGSALNCVHAYEADAYDGNESPCDQCAIRNTVLETLRTREGIHHVEVNAYVMQQGHPTELTFLLSTAPLFEKREGPQVLVSLMDITEQKQSEKKLREIGFHDALTGLYNRNFFQEEMDRLSDGRCIPIGVIVCDLDGLKLVNDTLGHQSGDLLLINAANILRHNLRPCDIIARIGGDEFAVLLPQTSRDAVEQILRRLRRAIKDHNNQDPQLPLSLSLGSAVSEERDPDIQDLFREADNLMYREKIQQKDSPRSSIVQVLTRSMQARDFEIEGHCDRLQALTARFCQSLGLSQDVENDLALLARFHDLGKVGIPDHILFKPGSLTEEEAQQMRGHCEIGHQIASTVSDLEPIADLILQHHEQWDGRGYPLGLSGRDIPLSCRILAIVDAYDAMISDRPYREAMLQEDAIAELKRCSGTQFDPELVEGFIQMLDSCRDSPESLAGSA